MPSPPFHPRPSLTAQCVQVAAEIQDPAPDLIVFPEYSERAELNQAAGLYPGSIVVGAVVEPNHPTGTKRGRGMLIHGGINHIDYLKIGLDATGLSVGTGKRPSKLPVYETGSICVGVLISMDVAEELGVFCRDVVDSVRASKAAFKVICIPAAMTASAWDWRSAGPHYRDLFVVLCNSHARSFRPRVMSFIAAPNGERIEERPVAARLSPSGIQ